MSTLLKITPRILSPSPGVLYILNTLISLPFATWSPSSAASAVELISFRWNIERLAVTRRQMPDMEYSTRLLVSSVLQGNIWVWPFLFIDWRLFCLPLLQKSGCVMLQEAATWHLVLSPDLGGENENCDTWWRNLPRHTWVDKVKSRKDVCDADLLQLPSNIWKNVFDSQKTWRYNKEWWFLFFTDII